MVKGFLIWRPLLGSLKSPAVQSSTSAASKWWNTSWRYGSLNISEPRGCSQWKCLWCCRWYRKTTTHKAICSRCWHRRFCSSSQADSDLLPFRLEKPLHGPQDGLAHTWRGLACTSFWNNSLRPWGVWRSPCCLLKRSALKPNWLHWCVNWLLSPQKIPRHPNELKFSLIPHVGTLFDQTLVSIVEPIEETIYVPWTFPVQWSLRSGNRHKPRLHRCERFHSDSSSPSVLGVLRCMLLFQEFHHSSQCILHVDHAHFQLTCSRHLFLDHLVGGFPRVGDQFVHHWVFLLDPRIRWCWDHGSHHGLCFGTSHHLAAIDHLLFWAWSRLTHRVLGDRDFGSRQFCSLHLEVHVVDKLLMGALGWLLVVLDEPCDPRLGLFPDCGKGFALLLLTEIDHWGF